MTQGLLSGKTCVITGGHGSIGAATARLFLNEGARCALIDINTENRELNVLATRTNNILSIQADVSNPSQIKKALEDIHHHWGTIDVLVCNAGIPGNLKQILECSVDDFESIYRSHVLGVFLTCKYGIPFMCDAGSVIINSSIAAFRSDPGAAAYICAKSAQIGLMRVLAKEVSKRGIRVNSIHPGPVENRFQTQIEAQLSQVLDVDGKEFFNQLIPLHRHAMPEEIAQAMLFLASNQSSFVTGHCLIVDGGLHL